MDVVFVRVGFEVMIESKDFSKFFVEKENVGVVVGFFE